MSLVDKYWPKPWTLGQEAPVLRAANGAMVALLIRPEHHDEDPETTQALTELGNELITGPTVIRKIKRRKRQG